MKEKRSEASSDVLNEIDIGLARCRNIILQCHYMQSDLDRMDRALIGMQRWFVAYKKNTE